MFQIISQIPPQSISEEKRNRKIYEKYLKGNYTYRSLARMYKVSSERIHQIVDRERKKEGGETKKED